MNPEKELTCGCSNDTAAGDTSAPVRDKEKEEQLRRLEWIEASQDEASEYVKTKLRVLGEKIKEESKTLGRFAHRQDEYRLEGEVGQRNIDSVIKMHQARRKRLHDEMDHWNRFDRIFHKSHREIDVLLWELKKELGVQKEVKGE